MRLDRVNYHFCTNKNAEIHKVKAHFRMPENAVPATYFHWFTEVGSSLQKPLLHTENVFETDSRFVPVEVPAVGRSSMAEVLYPAAVAGLIELRPLLPEDLRDEYRRIFFPEEQYSYEKRLVKCADKFSAYIKCIQERKAGNDEFLDAEKSTIRSIKAMNLEEADIFIKEFLPAYTRTLDSLRKQVD